MVFGFGIAMGLVKYGVYQPDNPNVVSRSTYMKTQTELNDAKQKLEGQRREILDTLSINTLILDTDSGQQRVRILKERLDNIPFFIPTTASAIGKLTSEEKRTNFLIAHWHAYRGEEFNHYESEDRLMEEIKDIYKSNPQALFLIYSSTLDKIDDIERLKGQIPGSIDKSNIKWVFFPYDPDECHIQVVLEKILNLGLERIPK
jgi:hypothetical protein